MTQAPEMDKHNIIFVCVQSKQTFDRMSLKIQISLKIKKSSDLIKLIWRYSLIDFFFFLHRMLSLNQLISKVEQSTKCIEQLLSMICMEKYTRSNTKNNIKTHSHNKVSYTYKITIQKHWCKKSWIYE